MGVAQLEPARVAQWIRAFACGAKGRVFESRRGRHGFPQTLYRQYGKGFTFSSIQFLAIGFKPIHLG
jgi:hypothetical protein